MSFSSEAIGPIARAALRGAIWQSAGVSLVSWTSHDEPNGSAGPNCSSAGLRPFRNRVQFLVEARWLRRVALRISPQLDDAANLGGFYSHGLSFENVALIEI